MKNPNSIDLDHSEDTWTAYCQRCGTKRRNDQLVQDMFGLYVCKHHAICHNEHNDYPDPIEDDMIDPNKVQTRNWRTWTPIPGSEPEE